MFSDIHDEAINQTCHRYGRNPTSVIYFIRIEYNCSKIIERLPFCSHLVHRNVVIIKPSTHHCNKINTFSKSIRVWRLAENENIPVTERCTIGFLIDKMNYR